VVQDVFRFFNSRHTKTREFSFQFKRGRTALKNVGQLPPVGSWPPKVSRGNYAQMGKQGAQIGDKSYIRN
jgi:hypothetical protein